MTRAGRHTFARRTCAVTEAQQSQTTTAEESDCDCQSGLLRNYRFMLFELLCMQTQASHVRASLFPFTASTQCGWAASSFIRETRYLLASLYNCVNTSGNSLNCGTNFDNGTRILGWRFLAGHECFECLPGATTCCGRNQTHGSRVYIPAQ